METMRVMTFRQTVLGHSITAKITVLDEGVHILLTGGTRTHVGAVSICDCDCGKAQTLEMEGHREGLITTKWAEALSGVWRRPVTVAGGIHYDNLSRQEIEEVVKHTDKMMEEILSQLKA